MGFRSVLSFAHLLVSERAGAGETVVDATVGNGVDTLFLAKLVGPSGTVYGFDIQQQAIRATEERLRAAETGPVILQCRSHAELLEAVPEKELGRTAAVMFNLGYLPGADQTVITRAESTVAALDAALTLLKTGGIITVILYTGHEGGAAEANEVQKWAERLPQRQYESLCYRFINRNNNPPYLLAIEKRG